MWRFSQNTVDWEKPQVEVEPRFNHPLNYAGS